MIQGRRYKHIRRYWRECERTQQLRAWLDAQRRGAQRREREWYTGRVDVDNWFTDDTFYVDDWFLGWQTLPEEVRQFGVDVSELERLPYGWVWPGWSYWLYYPDC